ncbi:MAG: ATP-binding protein [Ruminococcaceae bacterium]|nr:ATP-binding protein [Oscillospiraceae bacterium]
MIYTQILRVPILRSGQHEIYPAADLAARIFSCEETVELRLHRGAKRVECYIGTETPQRQAQLLLLLGANGYGFQTAERLPQNDGASRLLLRSVESRYILKPGQNPTQVFLPAQVSVDPTRAGALFTALSHCREGSGIAFFFRRSKPLDSGTVTALHNASAEPDSICGKLLRSGDLFEGVGCIYGQEEQGELLCSELRYNFSGLQELKIPKQTVSKNLLFAANHPVLPAPLKLLGSTFLPEELQVLSSLSASAGRYGLEYNKDTLFDIPLLQEPEKVPSIRLGSRQDGTPVMLALKQMRKHIGLFGPIGTGKGNMLFSVATQLYKKDIPILLIESAKEEQHHLGKVIPDLRCWRPKGQEFVLNPFCLPPGVTLREYRAAMLQQLRICFKLDGPLEELFSDTLNRCFAAHGYSEDSAWDDGTPFGMHEYMEEFVRLLSEDGYSQRTNQDVKTAGIVRLKALFNQDRDVFDSVNSVPVTELLSGSNVLQLNCLTTTQAKQLFASMLLVSISAYLRLRGTHCADKPLKLMIILDESHNLLQSAQDAQGKSFPFSVDFANMLLELRSQGVGVLIADQSADNIPSIITNTCATKIFLGGSPDSGIRSYMDSLRADEQALQHLYLCETGAGCYITEGMPCAQYFQTPNLIDCFELDKPYPHKNSYLQAHPELSVATFHECSMCPARGQCSYKQKTAARQRAAELTRKWTEPLQAAMAMKEEKQRSRQVNGIMEQLCMGAWTGSIVESNCALVQFIRDFNRVHTHKLHTENTLNAANRLWKHTKGEA